MVESIKMKEGNMMKRILALLLAISMVLAFAACSNFDVPQPTEPSVTDPNPTDPADPTDPSDPADPTEPPVETPNASEGLKFKLNNGGKSYSVEGIGSCADTEIVIPATYNDLPVTAICENAFDGNDSIISVVIPDSVTSIGYGAFLRCNLLVSVAIPDSIKAIGESAFRECSSLTEIRLPTGLKSIGTSLFDCCTSLTEITIPEGVTSIGTYAFYQCFNLANVTIPVSVRSIGDTSFGCCSNLKNIYDGGTIAQWEEMSKNEFWDSGCYLHSGPEDYNLHTVKN